MKRSLPILIALILCVVLCSCKSKDATAADDMILAIGEVTLDSEQDIIQAENAVNALEDKDYKQLEYLEELEKARTTYDDLVDRDDANHIIESINEIKDNVTLDSEKKIQSVRKAYEKCTDGAKKYVSNYPDLVKSEETLSTLKVENVIKSISAIGTVTLDSGMSISNAQTLFNKLSAVEKSQVSNVKTLNNAVETLETLREKKQEQEKLEREKAAKKAIAKMKVTTDKVEGITWYHSPNEPYYADSRSYVLPYIGKKDSSVWLRLRFHYTGNSWIFFVNLTIVVDGQKYYKTFSYYDVNRDNDTEVWEWVDIAPSTADIQMLENIADSQETIVRFQGDNYHYDLTIKSSDKAAIKDVLAAYNALNTI